jgi:5-methylcytosine-specific restriction endonuclease McrA
MPAVAYAAGRDARDAHRALVDSLAALDHARQCAVLWFGDIMRRGLFRELGYSSMNQYAREGLGFSRTRTGDFIRLVGQLEKLPAVRDAVACGEVGYTKAREIVKVATPQTERRWLEVARRPRREVVREVARVRAAAKSDPGQGMLLPAAGDAPVCTPVELPVRFAIDLTPEQEARRAALWERLRKLGGLPADRAEVLLEALAALVEEREEARSESAAPAARSAETGGAGVQRAAGESAAPTTTRRGPPGGPPRQIHIHHCPQCQATHVQTDRGERRLSAAETARAFCDATVSRPGKRNQATIRPAVRREVLARDRHRCRAPGCGRTRFLEVHHVTPRSQGGSNEPGNLITLCAACHRLWHEKGGRVPI